MFYPQAQPYFIEKQVLLNDKMRLVWSQHVYWTRMLILSIAERLKDLDYVTARLLRNPQDLGKVFADYYPPEAVRTIERLVTEHLKIGAALITALRDKQTEKAEELDRKWYQNSDEMANAFASVNPYYDQQAVRDMFYRHLDLTKLEAAKRLAGDYPADIKAFDAAEKEMLMMADYFSSGLRQQFPELFR